MTDIATAHDAVLFDLDGVIYLGPEAIPAAAPTLARLRDRGLRCGFVTNNASRSPGAVARQLAQLGIAADPGDVVTSAQAAARLLSTHLPAGAPVMVVGTDALADEVRSRGFVVVPHAEDHPAAVVQGLDPEVAWSRLVDAAIAVQRGALWIAANTDATKPGHRGLEPGNGAAVAVIQTTVADTPLVAGKPYAPLMRETVARFGCHDPIVVGDRLDTDIAGAHTLGIDSLWVLSGAHGPADLLSAPPDQRPTHLGFDVSALLAPPRRIQHSAQRWQCGRMAVIGSGAARQVNRMPPRAPSRPEPAGVPGTDGVHGTGSGSRSDWLDGLWALAHAEWSDPGHDSISALNALGPIPQERP